MDERGGKPMSSLESQPSGEHAEHSEDMGSLPLERTRDL